MSTFSGQLRQNFGSKTLLPPVTWRRMFAKTVLDFNGLLMETALFLQVDSTIKNSILNTQDGNIYPYPAAAVAQRPDADLKPENAIAHTWRDQSFLLSVDFGSGFIDWLPKTNKMLVLTWGTEAYPHENKESYLQLWDVDTGELTMLDPDGVYGRFSPDGNYLAYYTRSPESQIRVVNINSRKLLLSLPSVTLDLSVSIFTPSSIFNEALLWSPDNTQLIYRDEKENLALLNVTNGRSTPSLSAAARVSPIQSGRLTAVT